MAHRFSPTRFEDRSGAPTYVFPRFNYEHDRQQALRATIDTVVGGDYAHDFHDFGPAPKDPSLERIRFMLIEDSIPDLDTELATVRSRLYEIGRGKLFAEDSLASERWAWARLMEMPDLPYQMGDIVRAPCVASFLRLSDWFDLVKLSGTEVCTSATTNFNITNPGNAKAYAIQFRIRSNSAAGFDTTRVTNLTTGEWFETARVASSADDEVKVDIGDLAVQFSSDDGSTYADDFANLSTSALQVGWLHLDPGVNAIRVTDAAGTPNLDLDWEFWVPYH